MKTPGISPFFLSVLALVWIAIVPVAAAGEIKVGSAVEWRTGEIWHPGVVEEVIPGGYKVRFVDQNGNDARMVFTKTHVRVPQSDTPTPQKSGVKNNVAPAKTMAKNGIFDFAASSPAAPKPKSTGQGALTISGPWHFIQGESDGTRASVGGYLKLLEDGTYEDNHFIGGINTTGRGRYQARGNKLNLIPAAGTGQPQTYSYTLGRYTDKSGESLISLSLVADGGLTFLLVKEDK